MLRWLKRRLSVPPRPRAEAEPLEPRPTANAPGFQVSFQAGGPVLLHPAGLRFHAKLYLWTPLRVLRTHGRFVVDGSELPAAIPPEFGTWVRQPAAPAGWEPPEILVESDVGEVKPSCFLPFLVAFRSIVESDFSPGEQARKLNRLHLLNPAWKPFTGALRRPSEFHPEGAPNLAAVWFCPHLAAALPGLPPTLAAALVAVGYLTAAQVGAAPVADLLQVPGLSRAALNRLRKTQRASR